VAGFKALLQFSCRNWGPAAFRAAWLGPGFESGASSSMSVPSELITSYYCQNACKVKTEETRYLLNCRMSSQGQATIQLLDNSVS
jgi:hypothetical protein